MQRDLVLRWLEQIRALLARLLRNDPGASIELVDQQIDEMQHQILGTGSGLIDRLEPSSAAALLTDPFRIYGYAELLAFKSAVLAARGADPAVCRAMAERALALMTEAIRRADPVPAEWQVRIRAIEDDLRPPPQ